MDFKGIPARLIGFPIDVKGIPAQIMGCLIDFKGFPSRIARILKNIETYNVFERGYALMSRAFWGVRVIRGVRLLSPSE